MAIPLEKLRKHSKVEFPRILPSLAASENPLTLVKQYIKKAGLTTQVKPLTHEELPWLQEQGLDFKEQPERLTVDQLQAILELAPGRKAIEIGELIKPVILQEASGVAPPDEAKVNISLLVTTESEADAIVGWGQKKTKESTWGVWGIDESGTVYHFGTQT